MYSYLLSSRAPTAEELRLTREATTLEMLDSDLNEIHGNIMSGSVLIFEIAGNRNNIMKGKSIVLGRHKCVFFNRDAKPSDLVSVIREIILGQ